MITPIPMITIPNLQLVGISGKANSGKDTIAQYLRNQYESTYIYPFASQLKLAASILFGIPIEHFHERNLKEIPNPDWGISPRKIAQFLGTESVRDGFTRLLGESAASFWIKRLNDHINGRLEYHMDDFQRGGQLSMGDTVVIPDVRFQNEYDWVIANGGIIIQVTRPGADGNVGIAGHSSEMGYTTVDTERTFQCVNNGTLEQLYDRVDEIMKSTEPTADSMEL